MPRSNESIYELWEMEPEEFNQWRCQNDLLKLLAFFKEVLRHFEEWQAAHAIAAAGWPNVTASNTVKSATLEPGTPVALFQTRIGGGANYAGFRQQYDVAPDGRFLVNVESESAAPIKLILGWNPTP